MPRNKKINSKKPVIYAFIDSQNLNLGTNKDIFRGKKKIYSGWRLDFKRFRQYLSDKFRVRKAFLFIGFIPQNRKLYNHLRSSGYDLVFKPTVKDNQGKPKGNVDAELVLHTAALQYSNYDKAVIVSGDGDFYCLHEYLERKNKLLRIIIPNEKSESSLLRPFQQYKTFLFFDKEKLEFKP
ncbi:NYN domain-containing protein [Candidatus Gottesmanbacteria bacterium]|nr:NYN domain-containing protein [Candidatus Gottesmanbacteria bacterium]